MQGEISRRLFSYSELLVVILSDVEDAPNVIRQMPDSDQASSMGQIVGAVLSAGNAALDSLFGAAASRTAVTWSALPCARLHDLDVGFALPTTSCNIAVNDYSFPTTTFKDDETNFEAAPDKGRALPLRTKEHYRGRGRVHSSMMLTTRSDADDEERCRLRGAMPTTRSDADYEERCRLRGAMPTTRSDAYYEDRCRLRGAMPTTRTDADYEDEDIEYDDADCEDVERKDVEDKDERNDYEDLNHNAYYSYEDKHATYEN
ncbi:hypothetical protein BDZ89DRAFT_1041844 [Hymenopellis radicata]|nr:hypothetical protein BDZ89DRAFT_1041844 [Hymenopellis radicata]